MSTDLLVMLIGVLSGLLLGNIDALGLIWIKIEEGKEIKEAKKRGKILELLDYYKEKIGKIEGDSKTKRICIELLIQDCEEHEPKNQSKRTALLIIWKELTDEERMERNGSIENH